MIDGSILVIRVDLAQDFGPVELGQACIVVTTAGNAKVPGHRGVKLNVYRVAVILS